MDRSNKRSNRNDDKKKSLRDKQNLTFATMEHDKEQQRREKKLALFNPFTKVPKAPGLQLMDPDETFDDHEDLHRKNAKTITGEKPKSLI